MFERITMALVIGGATCAFYSSSALAQSRERGIRLYEEAAKFQKEAPPKSFLVHILYTYCSTKMPEQIPVTIQLLFFRMNLDLFG
jgi:hypothetical protein